jgi:DNA-binding transcriptional MerR regulator
MADNETLISTGGVAQRLGVPTSTLKFWERRGEIPASSRVEGSDRRVWRESQLPQIAKRVEEHSGRSSLMKAAA